MSRFLWKLQSPFYSILRRNPVSIVFLKAELNATRKLFESIPIDTYHRILDVGIGRGDSLEILRKYSTQIFGIDNCYNMLKRSSRNFPKVDFIRADILSLPFSISIFNLLICVGVSEYIKDKEKLLKNVYISLKPGGMAIITISTCHFLNYLSSLIKLLIFFFSEGFKDLLFFLRF